MRPRRVTRVLRRGDGLVLVLSLTTALLTVACSALCAAPSTYPAPQTLLYGFEPFGPFEHNPTGELVRWLAAEDASRQSVVLSVEPEAALGHLLPLMERQPSVILGFGVHVGVSHLQLNLAAINWLAMRSEADALYFGPIDPALPLEIAVHPTWANEAMTKISATGIAFTTSRDAGMHACNLALFYTIAHAAPGTKVVFFHVGPNVLERPELLRDIKRVVTALTSP